MTLLECVDEFKTKVSNCGLNISFYDKEKWNSISIGEYIEGKKTDLNIFYDIASLTKIITSSMIVELVKEGRLKLEQQISTILNNLIENSVGNLTIESLLIHKGATFRVEDIKEEYQKNPKKFKNRKYLKEFFFNSLEKNESDKIKYACDNYILLGFIIEQVYEMKLEDAMISFLKKHNLYPFITPKPDLNKTAPTEAKYITGEDAVLGVVQDEPARLFGGLAGNAGLFANTRGLQLLAKFWLENKLGLDEDLYSKCLYSGLKNKDEASFGLVWRVGLISKKCINMSGWSGPFIYLNIKSKQAFVCNMNYTYPDRKLANRSACKIWKASIDKLF